MLLETLDTRHNDVLIYSQNKFDFEDNFKIIFKRDEIKRPRKISYFDVCEIVKNPQPKNLIIYRLLTNVMGLNAYTTKYGYFIKIAGKMELIYFDPIFAIKDLRHLRFNLEPERFRFKIQQTGLSLKLQKGIEADYEEMYAFDLKAVEAQTQNDKFYADAIFAFDETYSDEEYTESKKVMNKQKSDLVSNGEKEKSVKAEDIAEDKQTINTNLAKVEIVDDGDTLSLRDEKINLLKNALGFSEEENNSIQQHKINKTIDDDSERSAPSDLMDLFKSTSKTDIISQREKEEVILRINRK